MKLTYKQRNGQERKRFVRKESSEPYKRRRVRAMKRLENQLLTGYKTVTNKETNDITTEPLTKEDRVRIEKEIETLKTRL